MNKEEIIWLLNRIEECQKRWKSSTRQMIFAGSYDIWENEQEGLNYKEIMVQRVVEASDLGLVKPDYKDKEWLCSWILTDLGKQFLKENQ